MPATKDPASAAKTQYSQINKIRCRKQNHYWAECSAADCKDGSRSVSEWFAPQDGSRWRHVLCISTRSGESTSLLWPLEFPGAPATFVSLPDTIYTMWTGRVLHSSEGPQAPDLVPADLRRVLHHLLHQVQRAESVCRVLSAQIRSTRVSWDVLAWNDLPRRGPFMRETTKIKRDSQKALCDPCSRRKRCVFIFDKCLKEY